MATKKELEKYIKMPWSYTIEQEDDYYIVYVNELPGICTDAKTIPDAMREIQEAISMTIELYLEQGKEIPIPISKSKYKGKIAYRTSARRHYLIAKLAQQKHQSLSKMLDALIDSAMEQIHRPHQ